MVPSGWGSMAGPAFGIRAMEDGLQSIRSLVQAGTLDENLRGAQDRYRRGMALDRLDHQPCSPARGGSKRGAALNAIGRSRGGASTKVHLVVDALGLPVEFEVTVGERHDSQPALELLARSGAKCALADKAYDSGAIRSALKAMNCDACIPSKADRIRPIPYDKHLFKARYEVECTFNLFKQARRFATRYEKTLRNYAAIVTLCCILCWLRI